MSHHRTDRTRHRTRRATLATGLAVALALSFTAVAVPSAQASLTPADAGHSGLFGSQDPTYDGVFRQSLAILALHAAGEPVAPAAVAWLKDQQCTDGAFGPFNPAPDQPCPAFDSATFTGGDYVDATALAAQALRAVGETSDASDAESWLKGAQSADGGWESTVGDGFGTNPNSSGLALMALNAASITPTHDPAPYFAALQIGRTNPGLSVSDHGSIAAAYDPTSPNLYATPQSIPGLAGADLVHVPSPPLATWARGVVAPATTPAADRASIADWATTWLAGQGNDPQYGTGLRAWSVLSFASNATGRDAAQTLFSRIAQDAKPTNAGETALAALAAVALRESDDAQRFATLTAATLTPATGRDSAAPTTWTVSSQAAWIGQTVSVRNPYAGTALQITQKVIWGDGSTTALTGLAATHAYAKSGTFRPSVELTYSGFARSATTPLAAVVVRADKVAPTVAVTVPTSPSKVSAWRTVRGTSKDNGLGVMRVTVHVVEKRGGSWYSYGGSTWTKRSSYATAVAAAKGVAVTPSATGAWSLPLAKLAKGTLKVNVRATDKAGNTSAVRTTTATLTR